MGGWGTNGYCSGIDLGRLRVGNEAFTERLHGQGV